MRRRVTYQGRVQGVGFRATVQRLASGLQVTGWVKNEPDGSVLLEAQGAAPEVEKLMASIRERMSGLVRNEQAAAVADVEPEEGFQIRY